MTMKPKPMLTRLAGATCVAGALLTFSAAAPAPPKLTGGNGTLYIGGWPGKVYVIDEATERVTGAIDVTTGAPKGLTLSKDKKHLYLVNSMSEQVEVLDIATRKSLDHFTLSEGRKKVR